MGHSGPRLLGIFPASFGALNPILPSTGGEAGAAHASHLTATLTSCPHSEWQGWASQAPWVARSAVREGGSGRDRRERQQEFDVHLEWLRQGGGTVEEMTGSGQGVGMGGGR